MAAAGLTGSAGLQSRYIWGGVLMDEGAVFQGSLQYTGNSGWLAGAWFSTVNVGGPGNNQIDVFAGYSGSADRFDYEAGIVRHNFTGDGPTDNDSDVTRAYFSGALGPAQIVLKSPLDDASWTSAGDIYASIGLVQELPGGFQVSGRTGFYYFADDAVFDNGTVSVAKTRLFAFRDAEFSLVHELVNARVKVGLHYTLGGERRDGSDLDDHVWFSIRTAFP